MFYGIRPGKVFESEDRLRQLGIGCLCVRTRVLQRVGRKTLAFDYVEIPLFGFYLFVQDANFPHGVKEDEREYAGVRPVYINKQPAELTRADVQRLRSSFGQNPDCPVTVGEVVRLARTFDALDLMAVDSFTVVATTHVSVTVEMEMLGAPRRLTVPRSHVERVEMPARLVA